VGREARTNACTRGGGSVVNQVRITRAARVMRVVRGIIHADDSCAAGAPVGASLVRLASSSSVIGLRRDLIVDRAFFCSATSCVYVPLGYRFLDEGCCLRFASCVNNHFYCEVVFPPGSISSGGIFRRREFVGTSSLRRTVVRSAERLASRNAMPSMMLA
jgi:hypothetical protein